MSESDQDFFVWDPENYGFWGCETEAKMISLFEQFADSYLCDKDLQSLAALVGGRIEKVVNIKYSDTGLSYKIEDKKEI